MSNVSTPTPPITAADLEGRMADVMRHAKNIVAVLPTCYGASMTMNSLRRLCPDLNHSIGQVRRVLAPLPETTLWAADLKHRLAVLERDVKEASEAAEAVHEPIQRLWGVIVAGGADAPEANEKWTHAGREAYALCRDLAQRVMDSSAAARAEGDKVRQAFRGETEATPNAPPILAADDAQRNAGSVLNSLVIQISLVRDYAGRARAFSGGVPDQKRCQEPFSPLQRRKGSCHLFHPI